MTRRRTPPISPKSGWKPLRALAAEGPGISLPTLRVRAWRALSENREDSEFEFARVAPDEHRSTVLARRRQPSPPPQ